MLITVGKKLISKPKTKIKSLPLTGTLTVGSWVRIPNVFVSHCAFKTIIMLDFQFVMKKITNKFAVSKKVRFFFFEFEFEGKFRLRFVNDLAYLFVNISFVKCVRWWIYDFKKEFFKREESSIIKKKLAMDSQRAQRIFD